MELITADFLAAEAIVNSEMTVEAATEVGCGVFKCFPGGANLSCAKRV